MFTDASYNLLGTVMRFDTTVGWDLLDARGFVPATFLTQNAITVASNSPYIAFTDKTNGNKASVLYYLPANISISANPGAVVCKNSSVTFTAAIQSGGTNPQYQWKKNGVNTGTNTPSYTASNLKTNDTIYCVMTANSIVVTSNKIVMTINPLPATPTISASGSTTNVCPGKTVTLTSSSGITYLWSTGATTQNIIVSAAGSYTVKVTNVNGCQSASSAATVVTYLTGVKPTRLVTSNITSTTTKISWTAVTCAVGYQYEWRVKGTIPYTTGQATAITKTLTGLLPATTYQWRLITACKINPDTITSAGYTNGPEFTTLAAAFSANDEGGTMDVKMEKGNLSTSIMPNPANNIATVKVSNATGKVYIRLTELSGKTLWQNTSSSQNTITMDVSRLAQGTYMVMVKDDKETKVMKLIKE